jgi:hypothetical protein
MQNFLLYSVFQMYLCKTNKRECPRHVNVSKQAAQRESLKSVVLIVVCCNVSLLYVIVCSTAVKILCCHVNLRQVIVCSTAVKILCCHINLRQVIVCSTAPNQILQLLLQTEAAQIGLLRAHWLSYKPAFNWRVVFGCVVGPNGCAAAHLLRLRVRIPPEACMSVPCECCVSSGIGLCVGPITHPEESR